MAIEGIIGKKVGMTQVFADDGALVPVTVIQAGPCLVVQKKTAEKDGYDAVQVGLVEKISNRRITSAARGHFEKAGVPPVRTLVEFPYEGDANVGDRVQVDIFKAGDSIDVVGQSKGKGFQGVMKRHHFAGGRATHGSMFHRAPGSIGASAFPSRVMKGMRMAGRMGGDQVTVKNLRVAKVDAENNLLYIRGAVPGGRNGLVVVRFSRNGSGVNNMPTIDIKDWNNKKVGSVDLPEAIFAYPYKEHLIHEAVRNYLASLRQGTHKVKNRSEVSGSGKKPFRQKGTGRARQGGNRPPIHRHGGTVFGPTPRDYSYKMNAKEKKNALKSALSQRVKEGKLVLLNDLAIDGAKTKALAEKFSGIGIDGKALLVDSFENANLALASRNNPKLTLVDALHVTVYDVVNARFVVLSQDALQRLTEALES